MAMFSSKVSDLSSVRFAQEEKRATSSSSRDLVR